MKSLNQFKLLVHWTGLNNSSWFGAKTIGNLVRYGLCIVYYALMRWCMHALPVMRIAGGIDSIKAWPFFFFFFWLVVVAYVLDMQGKIWDSSGCSLKYKSLVILPYVLSPLKKLDRAGVYWVGLGFAFALRIAESGYRCQGMYPSYYLLCR